MRGKFKFLYVDIWFDVTECKFITKNSSLKMLVVFSPIFVEDTKITFVYNFVAPLIVTPNISEGMFWFSLRHGAFLLKTLKINLLRWVFFIPFDNWKTSFFIQIYRYPEVWYNRYADAFSESVSKEVPISYSAITLQWC